MTTPTPNQMPPAKPRCANEEQKLRYDALALILPHNRSADEAIDLANWILTGEDGTD